jgi:hypothetical protein
MSSSDWLGKYRLPLNRYKIVPVRYGEGLHRPVLAMREHIVGGIVRHPALLRTLLKERHINQLINLAMSEGGFHKQLQEILAETENVSF